MTEGALKQISKKCCRISTKWVFPFCFFFFNLITCQWIRPKREGEKYCCHYNNKCCGQEFTRNGTHCAKCDKCKSVWISCCRSKKYCYFGCCQINCGCFIMIISIVAVAINIFPLVMFIVGWATCKEDTEYEISKLCYTLYFNITEMEMPPLVLRNAEDNDLSDNATKVAVQDFIDVSKISLLFSTTATAVSHVLFIWALWCLYIKHYKSVNKHCFLKIQNVFKKLSCDTENEEDEFLPLDPFNDKTEESDLIEINKEKEVQEIYNKKIEPEGATFFSTEDVRTNTPLQGERLYHYVTRFIIGSVLLIITATVFFCLYSQQNKDRSTNGTFNLEFAALILYTYSLFRVLVSCFIFSKLMYGIQRRCEEIELFVYHINEVYKFTGTSVTLPTGTNVTLPTDTNVASPTDTNITLSTDTNITLPTNTNITFTDTNVTLSTDTNVTFTDTNVTLSTDTNVTLPTGTNVTFTTNVTLPTDTNVTLSTDTNITLPTGTNITFTNTNITLPTDTNVTLLTDTNITLPTGTNITFTNTNVTLSTDTNVTLSTGTNITSPTDTNITLPTGTNVTLLTGTNVTLLTNTSITFTGTNVTLSTDTNVTSPTGTNIKLPAGTIIGGNKKLSDMVTDYLTNIELEVELNDFVKGIYITDKNAKRYLKARDRHFVDTAVSTLSWLQLWFLLHWILYIISTFMIMSLLIDAIALHVKANISHIEQGVGFHAGEIGFLFMFSVVHWFFLLHPCLRAASVTRTRRRVIRKISDKASNEYNAIPKEVMEEFIESMKRRKFSFRLRILCARIPFNLNIAYLSIVFGFVSVIVTLITVVTK